MHFCLGVLAPRQLCLAEMRMRAPMPWIEGQRQLEMLHGRIELPQPPVGVAEIILNIGIAIIA